MTDTPNMRDRIKQAQRDAQNDMLVRWMKDGKQDDIGGPDFIAELEDVKLDAALEVMMEPNVGMLVTAGEIYTDKGEEFVVGVFDAANKAMLSTLKRKTP